MHNMEDKPIMPIFGGCLNFISILINACTILHNMALYYRVPHPAIAADEFLDDEEENEAHLPMDGVSTRRRIVVQHLA
ncbi:hypothetical protein J437_LFUL005661 [Ladona fulva]|uniref:Uncharacterized protein n=1 Tax=Ladona fulva TaxID=123851 RepID=A0A8K0K2U9_LADFU|nr:hypothetical protein J437_LFUL005661 [Ladona fulva]